MCKNQLLMSLYGRQHRMLPTQRFRLRKEDGAGGGTGGTPSAGGDNGGGQLGGNSGESGQSGQSANNTGDSFDPSTFWNGPASDGSGASSGESASGDGGESGTQGSANLGQQLTTQLAAMTFGDPIFTPEVAEQINNGDFNGVQQRFNAMGQNIVRQSMAMAIQIMRAHGESLQTQMRSEFGQTLNGRDNNEALVRDFPSAKDPRVAPVIQRVFDQALKNTGGKRDLAVKQTKDMLALMSNVTSGDLGLNLVPQGADYQPQQPATNWLDELTVR